MPLATPLKRKSAVNHSLPFGRLGPVVDGGNLDTPAQRQAITGYALLLDQVDISGGGLNTRRQRGSSINLLLPFGRVGAFPDGGGLGTTNERRAASLAYEIFAPGTGPVIGGDLICNIVSLNAACAAQISRIPLPVQMRAPPQVVGRTIDWDAVVASAERAGGGKPGPKHIPVYNFSNGRRSRVFTELQ